MSTSLRIACGLAVAIAAAPACPTEPTKLIYLDQGWSSTDRNWFYTTTQGSRLVPLDWLLALETAAGEDSLATKFFVEKALYVRPASPAENPHGLPIGFVADSAPVPLLAEQKAQLIRRGLTPTEYREAAEFFRTKKADFASKSGATPSFWNRSADDSDDRGVAPRAKSAAATEVPSVSTWVGLTCAACHTAELHYRGQTIRIDGAPAMADFSSLLKNLVASLQQTADEPEKFSRFAAKVLGPSHDAAAEERLKAELITYTNGLAGLEARSRPQHPFGFSRLDAFGILTNEIVGTALGKPENYRTPDAPVSYPHLWDTPNLDWVQWNGSMHNPLARNVGEVLGVFADLKLPDDPNEPVSTSANVKNLYLLERQLKTLKAPRWPSDIFGSLSAERLERGGELFATHCAACHRRTLTAPNQHGRRFLKTTQVPLSEIGTDASMAMAFLVRTADPGIFGQACETEEPIPSLLPRIVGKAMRDEFDRLQLSPQDRLKYIDRRDSLAPTVEHLKGYKARDLAGIWATAPFLHNGSVPNLDELLRPAGERSKTFRVGSRKFDPDKVGFDTTEGDYEFDTALPGNGNGGHEYGASLTVDDRRSLIEYLKSL